MSKVVYATALLCVVGCGTSDPRPMGPAPAELTPTEITAEQAVRLAEEFIRANGYTDYAPVDVSKLDVDIKEVVTEEDKRLLKDLLAERRNTIKPRAYGWRRGRRNDPTGWTVGFELVETLNNDPSIGQAVEMDRHGADAWLEHMGFDLKSIPNKL
jgi:hypothetical protein